VQTGVRMFSRLFVTVSFGKVALSPLHAMLQFFHFSPINHLLHSTATSVLTMSLRLLSLLLHFNRAFLAFFASPIP
jgi:hypothetical protein